MYHPVRQESKQNSVFRSVVARLISKKGGKRGGEKLLRRIYFYVRGQRHKECFGVSEKKKISNEKRIDWCKTGSILKEKKN